MFPSPQTTSPGKFIQGPGKSSEYGRNVTNSRHGAVIVRQKAKTGDEVSPV